jgi:hypothetical protein
VDFDGAKAIANASGELDEAWLRMHCPRVLAGIERIAHWIS